MNVATRFACHPGRPEGPIRDPSGSRASLQKKWIPALASLQPGYIFRSKIKFR